MQEPEQLEPPLIGRFPPLQDWPEEAVHALGEHAPPP